MAALVHHASQNSPAQARALQRPQEVALEVSCRLILASLSTVEGCWMCVSGDTLCRTMATQLIMHERIETTLPKAKELRGFADRLITWGKQVWLSSLCNLS